MWRQNGVNANLFAYFRGSGSDRAVVVLHNGAAASGTVSMAFRDNPGIAKAGTFGDPGATFDVVKKLVALRRSHPALHSGA